MLPEEFPTDENEPESDSSEMTEREVALKKYEENLVERTWPAMFSSEKPELAQARTNDERAQILWDTLVPEFDRHIDTWMIPSERLPGETDEDFFTRIVSRMDELNVGFKAGFPEELYILDAFPRTAIEIGGLNCGLGSLVLVRALQRSGENLEDIEIGFPGPHSHAAIIHKGFYLDQANNVVEPIQRDVVIGGIQTYVLDLPEDHKIPFTRIPVTTPQKGIARVISNLDYLVSRANEGNENFEQMAKLAALHMDLSERHAWAWAEEYVMGHEWNINKMREMPEWQEEIRENERRFRLTPSEH